MYVTAEMLPCAPQRLVLSALKFICLPFPPCSRNHVETNCLLKMETWLCPSWHSFILSLCKQCLLVFSFHNFLGHIFFLWYFMLYITCRYYFDKSLHFQQSIFFTCNRFSHLSFFPIKLANIIFTLFFLYYLFDQMCIKERTFSLTWRIVV